MSTVARDEASVSMVPQCVLMETVLHYPAVGLRPALPYGEMAEKLWGEGREARKAFHTYDMKLVQAAADRSLMLACWDAVDTMGLS